MRLFVVQYVWLVFVYNLKGFGVWFLGLVLFPFAMYVLQ